MNIQIEEDKKLIEDFLIENDAHPLSSLEWGNVRELEGHKVYRLVYKKDENIIIYVQLITHKFPYLPFSIGEVWKGPIFSKRELLSQDEINIFFRELKDFCKGKKIIVTKIEPQIEDHTIWSDLLLNCPDIKRGEPTNALATSRIDLTKNLDEIYQNIDKYTRKNIRRSENRGVKIHIIDDKKNQIKALDTLYDLLKITSNRSHFRVREKLFFKSLLDQQNERFKIYIIEATILEKVISSYFVIVYGNGIFTPYSGSRRDLNEYKGNELVNWNLIKLGKELDLKYYDQWGILKANSKSNDTLQGVTNFKLSFGGERIEYIGALDLVIQPLLYRIFSLAWYLRKKLKEIKNNIF